MYIPRKNVENFRALAAKLTILKINPFARLTLPSTKGRGNLILPIQQKSPINSPRTYVESFMMLA